MSKIVVSARIDIRYLAVILPYLHEWGLNPQTKSQLLNDCFRALHGILAHNHSDLPSLPTFEQAVTMLASEGFTWEEGKKGEDLRLAIHSEENLPPLIPRSVEQPVAGSTLDDFAQRLVAERKAQKKGDSSPK